MAAQVRFLTVAIVEAAVTWFLKTISYYWTVFNGLQVIPSLQTHTKHPPRGTRAVIL